MDSGDAIQCIILIILLGLSAFFSSSETALTTVNKIRMRSMAEAGSLRAEYVLKVTGNPSKMLSAILIGNNIVNLYASALSTMLVTRTFGDEAMGLATGILTLLILVFGEISPKTMATIKSEALALRVARIIYILMLILTPAIFVVNRLSYLVLKILRVDPSQKDNAITEEELRTIVAYSHEEGVIETEEKKMINNVFDFGDSVAKDVMVPRIDMSFVDADATYEELMEIFRQEKYTRFPVYEETTDNVIGILNIKDVFLRSENEPFSVRKLLRQPLYTYEYKKISELMMEMRLGNASTVVVLDEYGATAGFITLEDMLEELVGEIRDEYDGDEANELVEVSPTEYVVDGSMKLDDLNESLGLKLESEDYDSVGGIVIENLDHLPEQGESVSIGNVRLVVEQLEKNRIDKIHVFIEKTEPEEEKETA